MFEKLANIFAIKHIQKFFGLFYEKEKNARLLLNKDVNTIIGTPEEDNEKV